MLPTWLNERESPGERHEDRDSPFTTAHRMCLPVTSRRCTLLETGVRELLEGDHYQVLVVPVGDKRHFPTVHLIATRGPGETRYIRIRKTLSGSKMSVNIELRCRREIGHYRKILARSSGVPGLHCEIWIYSVHNGYQCFEVLPDSIREIPRLAPGTGVSLTGEGTPG